MLNSFLLFIGGNFFKRRKGGRKERRKEGKEISFSVKYAYRKEQAPLWWSISQEPTINAGDMGSIPGGGTKIPHSGGATKSVATREGLTLQ